MVNYILSFSIVLQKSEGGREGESVKVSCCQGELLAYCCSSSVSSELNYSQQQSIARKSLAIIVVVLLIDILRLRECLNFSTGAAFFSNKLLNEKLFMHEHACS